MKKTLACILAAMILLPALAQAQGLLDFLLGGSPSGLTLRFEAAEEAAFADGHTRLIGASGDGRMLLLYSVTDIWMWDRGAGARVPLTFVRPEDAEALTAAAPTAASNARDRDSLQRMTDRRDEYLAAHGLTAFADMDQVAECFGPAFRFSARCREINDRWALVECAAIPCMMAIDLRSGETLLFFRENRARALGGSRLLLTDGILDLETRAMIPPEELDFMPAPEDGRPDLSFHGDAPTLCEDGSLLAVCCEGPYGTDAQPYWLVDVRADANRAFPLGSFRFGDAPDRVMTAGDTRWVLLCSESVAWARPFLILDRETGAVTPYEAGRYLPVAPTAYGFLCWDLSTYNLLRLDPATGGTERIALGDGFDWTALDLSVISSITANGQGMYFAPNPSMPRDGDPVYVRGWFVLEGE